MRRLEGGFINNVFLEDGIVVKVFSNDGLVGMSSYERLERERRALSIFGGTLAPRLISSQGVVLRQEFIEGESYETMARRREEVFEAAGRILAKIHRFQFPDRTLPPYYLGRFRRAVEYTRPILELEQISPVFEVAWDIIYEQGVRYVHGDFWLGNIIGKIGEDPKVIDWEFSRVGSPYEDFAIVDLWIFREFSGSEHDFWRGYGIRPDQEMINSFLVLKCVEFLATVTLEDYLKEENDGFYHNKITTLKSLIK
ncbi:MAG: aminoglycoside phosphotransferase family protein [Candidatus Yanofskybacteria bacterium]|nr:aminoglycoside phosphotransferase family protein [Candidatus Yanofskybacteria bacterium]